MKVLLLVVEFFPLLLNSDIFLNFPTVVSKSMYENKGKRKQHTLKWMQKKSMAIPEAILELQNGALRESALRCLSNFLLEVHSAQTNFSEIVLFHRTSLCKIIIGTGNECKHAHFELNICFLALTSV